MKNHAVIIMDAVRYDVYDDQEFDNLPNNALKAGSAACWTLPSFFSMFLGWSPANAERWAFNAGGQANWIPEVLQDRDYYTAFHSGSAWFALPHMKEIFSNGFENFDVDFKNKDRMQDYTKVKYDKEPFFHVFHVLEPHHPFQTGNGVVEAKRDKDHNWKAQEQALNHVDQKFGQMIKNMPDGTIVTVTADHADAWGEGKEQDRESWGHNVNSANMEGFMLRRVGTEVTDIPYSRGRVNGDEVEWEDPENLRSEWKNPREADFE